MDKTIKINLAGILFQIDEKAYHVLRHYLQSIDARLKNVAGGHETIDDIESRIAEIFQTQQGIGGVISVENVEAMISMIGKPEDFDLPEGQPEIRDSGSSRRRLYRNTDDSIIGGVCGGLGAYLNTDPVWIRIIFILFTFGFGIGFFIYLALWIALQRAVTEAQKRELYGDFYNYKTHMSGRSANASSGSSAGYSQGSERTNGVGNAFNEVFRAIGKFCFIVFRIFMIIFGIAFVLMGFMTLLAFILVFFFRYPGFIAMGSMDTNLFYLPDLLHYIVSPSITPWILILSALAVILPLIGLIYWGIKMIFWFRVKDGIISLILLVVWVLSIAALSLILFNEGVSFSQSGRSSSEIILDNSPDTLHIITGKKASDLHFTKELTLPDDDYTVFMADSTDQLFIRTRLRLNLAEDKLTKIEIRRRSSGRTTTDAVRKAESLIYNYKISNDTLYLDDYFTVPAGNKWAGDNLSVALYIPEKTVLYFDNESEKMFYHRLYIYKMEDNMETSSISTGHEPSELGGKYWIISEDGLQEAEKIPSIQK
jgi:phage shock protein PspC (stress-responsive transcriptional regulator)